MFIVNELPVNLTLTSFYFKKIPTLKFFFALPTPNQHPMYMYMYMYMYIHIYETCSIKEILQLLRWSESNPQPLDRHVPGVWYLATTCAIFVVSWFHDDIS